MFDGKKIAQNEWCLCFIWKKFVVFAFPSQCTTSRNWKPAKNDSHQCFKIVQSICTIVCPNNCSLFLVFFSHQFVLACFSSHNSLFPLNKGKSIVFKLLFWLAWKNCMGNCLSPFCSHMKPWSWKCGLSFNKMNISLHSTSSFRQMQTKPFQLLRALLCLQAFALQWVWLKH